MAPSAGVAELMESRDAVARPFRSHWRAVEQ
jgi:hypothetical protein